MEHWNCICAFRFSLSNAEVKQLMQQLPSMLKTNPSLGPQSKATECPYLENIPCQSRAHYRRHDGRCNNLLYPLWGSTHQPQTRFLPPDYSDGEKCPTACISQNTRTNVIIRSTRWGDGQRRAHDFSLRGGDRRAENQGRRPRTGWDSLGDGMQQAPSPLVRLRVWGSAVISRGSGLGQSPDRPKVFHYFQHSV